MDAAAVRLELVLEPGSEPIAGCVGEPGRPGRAFTGYLELLAVLERLRAPGTAPAPLEGTAR